MGAFFRMQWNMKENNKWYNIGNKKDPWEGFLTKTPFFRKPFRVFHALWNTFMGFLENIYWWKTHEEPFWQRYVQCRYTRTVYLQICHKLGLHEVLCKRRWNCSNICIYKTTISQHHACFIRYCFSVWLLQIKRCLDVHRKSTCNSKPSDIEQLAGSVHKYICLHIVRVCRQIPLRSRHDGVINIDLRVLYAGPIHCGLV
jgi:hypothetical protein